MLPFVLVDTLDLNVKHGLRINTNAGFLQYVARQAHLDIVLDPAPIGAKGRIVCEFLQAVEFIEVSDPGISYNASHQCRLLRVAHRKPTPRRHSIRYVNELLGP